MAVLTQDQFRQLVDENIAAVYWVAHKNLKGIRHTKEEQEVFIQDLFAYVMSRWHAYDPEKSRITTWLNWQARHIRSRFLQERAKAKNQPWVEVSQVANLIRDRHDQEETDRQLDSQERYDRLVETIRMAQANMSGPQKTVAEKVLIGGTPVRDLARTKGCHHNAVLQVLQAVRRKVCEVYFRREKVRASMQAKARQSYRRAVSA